MSPNGAFSRANYSTPQLTPDRMLLPLVSALFLLVLAVRKISSRLHCRSVPPLAAKQI